MTERTPQQFTNKEIQKIVDTTKDITRQESNPKPKENIGTKIKRISAAGAAAVTIATGAGMAAGCDQIQKTTFTTVDTSEKPSVKPTEVPTQPIETKTTAKPTESKGAIMADFNFLPNS